jgi:hypothetical protein
MNESKEILVVQLVKESGNSTGKNDIGNGKEVNG